MEHQKFLQMVCLCLPFFYSNVYGYTIGSSDDERQPLIAKDNNTSPELENFYDVELQDMNNNQATNDGFNACSAQDLYKHIERTWQRKELWNQNHPHEKNNSDFIEFDGYDLSKPILTVYNALEVSRTFYLLSFKEAPGFTIDSKQKLVITYNDIGCAKRPNVTNNRCLSFIVKTDLYPGRYGGAYITWPEIGSQVEFVMQNGRDVLQVKQPSQPSQFDLIKSWFH